MKKYWKIEKHQKNLTTNSLYIEFVVLKQFFLFFQSFKATLNNTKIKILWGNQSAKAHSINLNQNKNIEEEFDRSLETVFV